MKKYQRRVNHLPECRLGGVEVVLSMAQVGHEKISTFPYLAPHNWIECLDHTVRQSSALIYGVYMSVASGCR
jgi:hypothetical protein